MLVSFIIPSYNSAHTVARCLDSIFSLSLEPQEFQVIFIDDCSTDNTCEIVEAYSQPLPEGIGVNNLTLLKQPKNNRQGAARNRGVEIAKGEYICFVDSDDAVTEGVVTAIQLAKEMQTDMTAYHYAYVSEGGTITKDAERLSFPKGQMFSGVEMQNRHPYWNAAAWSYIYSKEFLKRVNYSFAEEVLYEDTDFVMAHLYQAERMVYSQELGYIMYYREGSTTHSMTHKNLADYLLLGMRMYSLYERVNSEQLIVNREKNKFAEGILEGACFNVERSCRRLLKLNSVKEVRAYYDRVDTYVNRQAIVVNKHIRSYYWNKWTSLCMKHENLTILMLAIMVPVYRWLSVIRSEVIGRVGK